MFVFVNSFAFVCVFVFVTAAREEWNQGCVTIGGVSHPQFSRPLNIIARQALSETVTNQIEGRCKCRVTQVTFSGLILTLERFLPCPLRILTFFDCFMISPFWRVCARNGVIGSPLSLPNRLSSLSKGKSRSTRLAQISLQL